MAKKRQKKRAKLQKRLAQVQAKGDAGALLREAVAALRRGGTERVIGLANEALRRAEAPAESEAARALIVEAHVRAGVSESGEARLEHFERALEIEPDLARLRFYRGLCLWQLGRLHEALEDLTAAEEKPEARLFAALARLALGQEAPRGEGLGKVEENTLKLVAGIIAGEPSAELPTPLLGGAQAEALWRALHEMARGPEAAPLDELAAAKSAGNLTVKRFAAYYLGVAALRRGDRAAAEAAWQAAEGAGPRPAKLADNLTALRRELALELADAGHYEALADMHTAGADQVQRETLALAYEHQGFAAARRGDWRKAVHDWREAYALRPRRQLAQNLALAEEAREHWHEAAEAWRAMLKRRPRKEGHPDYLSDAQVASIWRHAGQCYRRDEDLGEAIRCFKQALKYAEGDAELRFELAEALRHNDQQDAAENELERLLAIAPEHKEALVRLAAIYEDSWRKDPTPLWRRALALEPHSREVRDALARAYLREARVLPQGKARKHFERGLEEIPEHPALLIALAFSYEDKELRARELFERAYRASAGDVGVVGLVLRELARREADDLFEEIVAEQRQRRELLPAFWLDNGEETLQRLGEPGSAYAQRLFDEGVALAERARHDPELRAEIETTKASALAFAFEAAFLADDEDLVAYYRERIATEVAASGAPEYIEAYRLFRRQEDEQKVERLLREAERKAKRAGDGGILASIEAARDELDYGTDMPRDLRRMFERLRSEFNV